MRLTDCASIHMLGDHRTAQWRILVDHVQAEIGYRIKEIAKGAVFAGVVREMADLDVVGSQCAVGWQCHEADAAGEQRQGVPDP